MSDETEDGDDIRVPDTTATVAGNEGSANLSCSVYARHEIRVVDGVQTQPCALGMSPIVGVAIDASPADFVCLQCARAIANALAKYEAAGGVVPESAFDPASLNPDQDVDLSEINPTEAKVEVEPETVPARTRGRR